MLQEPVVATWSANPNLSAFVYERGEGRYKHKWRHDQAGFIPSKKGSVGKCHSSITPTIATMLLQSGFVEVSPYGDSPGTPDAIYNVYRGVPYVAVKTQPGRSYHGYPWAGRMSATIKAALRARAVHEGTARAFDRWLADYEQA